MELNSPETKTLSDFEIGDFRAGEKLDTPCVTVYFHCYYCRSLPGAFFVTKHSPQGMKSLKSRSLQHDLDSDRNKAQRFPTRSLRTLQWNRVEKEL